MVGKNNKNEPARIVLSTETSPQSCRLKLDEPGRVSVDFSFTVVPGPRAAVLGLPRTAEGEALLDGPAFAALPTAMARRRALHVRGTLSRSGLRELTDYACAFGSWRRDVFAAVPVTADRIVDLPPEVPDEDAILAWDGSLAAAAMLVRHVERLRAGTFRPRAILHVGGLGLAEHDREVVRAIEAPAAAMGIDLIRIVVEGTARDDLVHPVSGRLPVVAAAMHLAAGGCRIGLVARRWPYAAIPRRPRPHPHAPDMSSGGRFALLTDGGGLRPDEQARLVVGRPDIAAAIRPTGTRDAQLTAIGFAAARQVPPVGARLPGPLTAALRLDLADLVAAATAPGLARAAGRHPAGALLRARVAVADAWRFAAEHALYAARFAGWSPPWPR